MKDFIDVSFSKNSLTKEHSIFSILYGSALSDELNVSTIVLMYGISLPTPKSEAVDFVNADIKE